MRAMSACFLVGFAYFLASSSDASAETSNQESGAACGEAEEPLRLGVGIHTIDCRIEPAVDIDRFLVSAAMGEVLRVVISGLTRDLDVRLEVRAPDGSVLVDDHCNGRDRFNDPVTCSFSVDLGPLAQTGDYQLAISDYGANETGNYVLQMEKLSRSSAAGILESNTVVSGDLSPVSDVDFFLFEGVEGATVRLTLLSRTPDLDPMLEVFGPDQAPLTDSCTGRDRFNDPTRCSLSADLTIRENGSYLVAVSDAGFNEEGGYELGLQCLSGPCQEQARTMLRYGEHTLEGKIYPAVDSDVFFFDGRATEPVRLKVMSLTPELDPTIEVRGPDGNLVRSASCTGRDNFNDPIRCCFSLDVTLPLDGTYSVLVFDGGANERGCYVLQLESLRPAAPPPLPYNSPVRGAIAPTTDMDFFSFEGAANTQVRATLRSLTPDLDPLVEVWSPSGQLAGSSSCTGRDRFNDPIRCSLELDLTLSEDGTYHIAVSECNEEGEYEIGLQCMFGNCPSVSGPEARADTEAAVLAADSWEPRFQRGDCNQDGVPSGNVTDGLFLLNYLFQQGPPPRCRAACDFNGDGSLSGNTADALYFFNFNFLGGPPIPAPLYECGYLNCRGDLSLGCEEPMACRQAR